MSRIVALDTETTGLDSRTEQTFEVAAIEMGTGLEYVWRIEPTRQVVERMHPKAIEVNRYHERVNSSDWRWDQPDAALAGIAEVLDGAQIIGAVPDFDTRHLTATFWRFGMVPPRWKHRLWCVETLVMGHLGCEVEGLAHAAELMGVEVPHGAAHTALGDARTVAAIWLAWRAVRRGDGVNVEHPIFSRTELDPETFYAIRRTDGDDMFGEYGFVSVDGPDDWNLASEDAAGRDAASGYELVEMTVRVVGRRTLPTCHDCDQPAEYWGLCEPHAREDDPDYFVAGS